jgi:hypothetical protein
MKNPSYFAYFNFPAFFLRDSLPLLRPGVCSPSRRPTGWDWRSVTRPERDHRLARAGPRHRLDSRATKVKERKVEALRSDIGAIR